MVRPVRRGIDLSRAEYDRLTFGTRPLYQLKEPVVFRWGINTLVVQQDFYTDFSSIPVWARRIVPINAATGAGVIHDALCRYGFFYERECDAIHYWASLAGKETRQTAGLMYRALRLWAPFRKHGYEVEPRRVMLEVKFSEGGRNEI